MDKKQRYLDYLYNDLCNDRYDQNQISFRKLFEYLLDYDFHYSILYDDNRAADGLELRYHICRLIKSVSLYERWKHKPCSMLEMLAALAIKCEDIMDDPAYGDRTSFWFWNMIVNLGLGGMDDTHFDQNTVDYVLERFLNHKYSKNGKGGLFTVPRCKDDLRKVEIWVQMCHYLNTLV